MDVVIADINLPIIKWTRRIVPLRMAKIAACALSCILFSGIAMSQAYAATPISYGTTVSGSITAAGQKNEYTFSGANGEVITVRFAVTSGNLYTAVDLVNPSGTTVISAYSGAITSSLAATGTFKLIVRDYYGAGMGNYVVSIQRVNNPVNAAAAVYGQTVNGTISVNADMKAYVLNAAANDIITARTAVNITISGSFEPYMELYNPAGILLSGYNNGNITQKVNATGNYTLLISDRYRNGAGIYNLYIQRVNNPANAAALIYGQTIAGTITVNTDMKAYVLNAAANDVITARTAVNTTISGSFEPYMELYNPAGILLTGHNTGVITQKVNATGNYTLLVSDLYRNGAGTYECSPQRTNNPANVTALANTTVTEGNISSRTAMSTYSFSAPAGTNITVCSAVKATTFGSFGPYLELFNAAGTALVGISGGFTYPVNATGVYYLFVSDTYRDGAGWYKVFLSRGSIACSSLDLIDPQVTVIRPAAAEIVDNGFSYAINWTSSDNKGISIQEIRLSTDSGVTWPTVIATGLNASIRSYPWSVSGNLTSPTARIQVSAWDVQGNKGINTTAGDFVIVSTTSPAGARDAVYVYDSENRLTNSTPVNAVPANYTYDGLGNRLNMN